MYNKTWIRLSLALHRYEYDEFSDFAAALGLPKTEAMRLILHAYLSAWQEGLSNCPIVSRKAASPARG